MRQFEGYTKREILFEIKNDNIPNELQNKKRWVVYTVLWDDNKGKWCKIPVYETVNSFRFYNKDTPLTINKCLTYEAALAFYSKDFTSTYSGQTLELYGLGFYIPGSEFSCVDLDYRKTKKIVDCRITWEKSGRCIDAHGKVNTAAKDLLDRLSPAWVERSVSKTGLHIWYQGPSPLSYKDNKTKYTNFHYTVNSETISGEWYDGAAPDNQFIALTGHIYGGWS